jgi:hypothetical protein
LLLGWGGLFLRGGFFAFEVGGPALAFLHFVELLAHKSVACVLELESVLVFLNQNV